jgi:hypothetical protein
MPNTAVLNLAHMPSSMKSMITPWQLTLHRQEEQLSYTQLEIPKVDTICLASQLAGRLLNRIHWTSLPIPGAEVIDRVHALAHRNAGSQGIKYNDRLGNPYLDPDTESNDPDDET